MKVSRGNLKGRKLLIPAGIRPVSLKVKEACFNILGQEVQGRKVLDLYAGSGALGIEALSLGVKEAVFIDNSKASLEVVKTNLTALNLAELGKVYLKDASFAVADLAARKEFFDLIFLDPPYYKGVLKIILPTIEEYDIVTNSGFLVCFCYLKDEIWSESLKFSLIVEKKYGQNRLLIYRKDELR